MSGASTDRARGAAAIDIARPHHRPGRKRALRFVRGCARWLHLLLAAAVVLGIFVQVYLIGAYIFGAGHGALDAHESMGWTIHGFEMLVFLAALVAWLPWIDLVLSLLLAVIGTAQVTLASEHGWVGGLHPLLALVVLSLAVTLALRAIHRHRITAVAGKQEASELQLEGEPI